MSWSPEFSWEERLKHAVVPPGLYIRHLYRRARRRGEAEIALLPFLARRDRVSLDVGANKGVYTYALLACSAAVHAFEPNPKMFRILQSWARARATLHCCALGERNGTAEFHVPRSSRGYSNQGGSLLPVTGRDSATLEVPMRRLDDLGLDDVGFIKIDVEGYEQEVLAGGTELLRRCRPNLLVELEEKHTGRPLAELVGAVCVHGFECLALSRGVLTPFRSLDLERCHRRPLSRADYIYNFVFLPA